MSYPSPLTDFVPAFIDNNIPIFFTVDANFVPYLSVALESILSNISSAFNYDIVIISDADMPGMAKYLVRQGTGYTNVSIRILVIDIPQCAEWTTTNRISKLTYYRLFFPGLFPAYGKILFLDSDLVVLANPAELYHSELHGKAIAGVLDPILNLSIQFSLHNRAYLSEYMGMSNFSQYINAGVIVMDLDKIRQRGFEAEFIKLGPLANEVVDQHIINAACTGFIALLPPEWNIMTCALNSPPSDAFDSAYHERYLATATGSVAPKIVHFAGDRKPWNILAMPFAAEWWQFARTSPFYESLLSNAIAAKLQKTSPLVKAWKKIRYVYRVVTKLLRKLLAPLKNTR